MIIWLNGVDEARVSYRLAQLSESVSNTHDMDRLDANATLDELWHCLCTDSIFFKPKVVLIKNPWWLFGSLQDKDWNQLSETWGAFPSHHQLWVVSTKKVDMRLKGPSNLKKKSQYEEFTAFEEWDVAKARQWVLATLDSQLGLPILTEAKQVLADYVGTNVGAVYPIMDTLKGLGVSAGIGISEILLVLGPKAGSLHALTTAIKQRHHANICANIQDLMRNGEDVIKLVATVGSTVELLLFVVSHPADSHDIIGKKLGRHPYFIKQTMQDVGNRYAVSELVSMMIDLHHLDMAIKSGRIRVQDAPTRLIILLTNPKSAIDHLASQC